VATFVDELYRLQNWQSWIYGTLSLLGAQIVLSIVNMFYLIPINS